MAIAGLVTGGATALGLAALTVSLHLPTNAYRQERTRRMSESQSAANTQVSRAARELILTRENSREGANAQIAGAMMPPGRRFSFGVQQGK